MNESIVIVTSLWLHDMFTREYPEPPRAGVSEDVLREYAERQRMLITLQDVVIELLKAGAKVEVLPPFVEARMEGDDEEEDYGG